MDVITRQYRKHIWLHVLKTENLYQKTDLTIL